VKKNDPLVAYKSSASPRPNCSGGGGSVSLIGQTIQFLRNQFLKAGGLPNDSASYWVSKNQIPSF
jgi:hypothetical protein